MLYDPKWEVKSSPVKPPVRSIAGLVAWLEKQPAQRSYVWHDCEGHCLIGLYGAAMGMGLEWHNFHSDLFDAHQLSIASDAPYAFGAALGRARKVLDSL